MAVEGSIDEHDLEIAGAIQRALLPTTCPRCPHGRVSAGHRMQASVGGDFYDFPDAGPGKLGLLIGDVMGHGVSAGLLMAMIVGLLRRESQKVADPLAAARLINDRLYEVGQAVDHALLCTFFYGVMDLKNRTLEFVNAGHPAPIVCNRETCLISGLSATCTVLGAVDSDDLEASTHTFSDEDRITLYTDGIPDAQNPSGERFGERRLHRIASDSLELSSADLIKRIFDAVDEFAQGLPMTDDQSIVTIDFGARAHGSNGPVDMS